MKNRNFKGVWIPKEIYLANDLLWSEKILLIEIDSLDQDDEKGCFASSKYLSEFLDTSPGTIRNMIASLKQKGYVYELWSDGKHRGLATILRTDMRHQKMKHVSPTDDAYVSPTSDAINTIDLLNNTNKNILQNEDVLDVFSYWKEVFKHPKAKLDKKRATRIMNHLKNGFNPDDLKRAIRGVTKSPWHIGENPTKTVYDKIDTIFRDSDQVEHFMELSDKTVHSQHRVVAPAADSSCTLCTPERQCKFHDANSEYNKGKAKHAF